MKRIVLDKREKADISALVAKRVASYTPEWRYEGGTDDPGAAIAALFCDMFSGTVERLNRLPEKYYTEFLNLLGAPSPTVTPAQGYLELEAADAQGAPVAVPGGTEVFAAAQSEDEEDVVFSTAHRIEVTSAKLEDVYYADAAHERIERLRFEGEEPFFAPTGAENLQKHLLSIRHNGALNLSVPCTVEVRLNQSARFMEDAAAKLLADGDFARWLYFDGEEFRPFDAVRADSGLIILDKNSEGPFAPEQDGNRYIYCEALLGASGTVKLAGAQLRVSPHRGIKPQSMAGTDVPVSLSDGGYCFSRKPSAYEAFYLRCDEALSKRGADAMLRLDITPVVSTQVGNEPQYEFNKRIIDKTDAVRIVPDDVYVDEVVWEYHNGRGWAPLKVGGNVNPFSCRNQGAGELNVTFTVPADIEPVEVNAEEGLYIRARVVNVANFLSVRPRWLSPFVREAELSFKYPEPVRAQALRSENNAQTELVEDERADELDFTAFSMMQEHPRAMYLRFSSSPHALPLSLLFNVAGDATLPCKISFEAWNGKDFAQVRSIDNTRNLRYTGTALLYLTEPVPQMRLFGEDGCFLRMSLSTSSETTALTPHITGIRLNIVNAVQTQRAPEQVFSTGAYDAGKTLELLESPVERAQVWVDEAGSLSRTEAAKLRELGPERVRTEDENGENPRFWVLWDEIETLERAKPGERVYELDSFAGIIRFGSGANGMVPPQGELNIRVEYSYGGGSRGNLPKDSVRAFLGSVPFVSDVRNIAPMGGGTDRPETQRTESLGNSCIRHRSRALGAFDFEQLTLSRFQKAAQVKCFPNTDRDGVRAPGQVCLVVMEQGESDERATAQLCREIYDELSKSCDCNLVASGALHIIPSMEITVNAHVLVKLEDVELAAVTQQQIADNIASLIECVWRGREIGAQIRPQEIYQAVKATPNVNSITQILLEGSYYRDGRRRLCALEADAESFPFATVKNGAHTVRIG